MNDKELARLCASDEDCELEAYLETIRLRIIEKNRNDAQLMIKLMTFDDLKICFYNLRRIYRELEQAQFEVSLECNLKARLDNMLQDYMRLFTRIFQDYDQKL